MTDHIPPTITGPGFDPPRRPSHEPERDRPAAGDRRPHGGPGEGPEPAKPREPRFPVVMLAAPGAMLGLFAAMADRLATGDAAVAKGLLIGSVVAVAGCACFGAMAALSTEPAVKKAGFIAIGLTLLAFGLAAVRMI